MKKKIRSISIAEKIDEKDFAVVEISASNKPVFMNFNNKEEFFVRHAASTSSYKMSEANEYISKHWS